MTYSDNVPCALARDRVLKVADCMAVLAINFMHCACVKKVGISKDVVRFESSVLLTSNTSFIFEYLQRPYLIHIGVVGSIVAIKIGAVLIDNIVVVGIVIAVPAFSVVGALHVVIVVAVANVLKVMSKAGLADPPGIEGRVPRGKGIVKVAVHGAEVIAIVGRATATSEEEVAKDVLHLRIAGVVLRARGIGVQARREVAVGLGLEVVVQGHAGGVLPGIVAALGPSLAGALHEVMLLGRPDAESLVLEELLHKVVVAGVLEEAQEGEVGVVEVAVHLGAAGNATLGILAGGGIPRLVGAVPVLVLSDSTALIVHVDVLN